jgi:Rieske Fe-S protein
VSYDWLMAEHTIGPSEIERRRFLQGAIAVVAVPPVCCRTPSLPPVSVAFETGKITVDLTRVPELLLRNAAYSVTDEGRKINVIVIHAERGHYIAMDRSCTHGGAQCTYNPKRRTLQCTSLNHAEYDLRGTLLHGRTHGNLRTYKTEKSGSTVVIWLEDKA